MKLTDDSRQVVPGALFIAIKGESADGHRYQAEAIERGAVALVGEEPDRGLGVPYIRVPDSRLALAQLEAAWYGHPSRKMIMIGVTGTDGKTTSTNLIFRILKAGGLSTGMISTVNAVIGDEQLDTGFHVTTPNAQEVQSYLAQMVSTGLSHCVLEVTSHGLYQHRVSGCEFDIAMITNITHEHLDYHGSMQTYRKAKGRLFYELLQGDRKPGGPEKAAILNRDDSSYDYLHRLTKVSQISYGLSPEANVRAIEIESGAEGLKFIAEGPGYRQPVISRLHGEFNAANILGAFAAGVEGLGIKPEKAAEGIASLTAVPGRMEHIDLGQPFTAMVDFAHTPNALSKALKAARQMTDGKVIAVFGSAGLRDREKRQLMAEVSVKWADETILTAEDPRTESLDDILEEMANGARTAGGVEGFGFWRVPDRGQALQFAVQRAEPGDLVITCGKGHEQSMCFGDTEYPWDDRVALRAALAELLGVAGPEMPRLPTS